MCCWCRRALSLSSGRLSRRGSVVMYRPPDGVNRLLTLQAVRVGAHIRKFPTVFAARTAARGAAQWAIMAHPLEQRGHAVANVRTPTGERRRRCSGQSRRCVHRDSVRAHRHFAAADRAIRLRQVEPAQPANGCAVVRASVFERTSHHPLRPARVRRGGRDVQTAETWPCPCECVECAVYGCTGFPM